MSVPDTAPVINLRNIGPQTSKWLEAIGITTAGQLRSLGAIEAYIRVCAHFGPHTIMANKMFLYALWGALNDFDCLKTPQEVKDSLNEALKAAGS